jgi:predicted Zn-dependent protease
LKVSRPRPLVLLIRAILRWWWLWSIDGITVIICNLKIKLLPHREHGLQSLERPTTLRKWLLLVLSITRKA